MSGTESEEHDEISAVVGLALPSAEARERLVGALANVLAQAGWERFVTHPILLPSAEYFPDAWKCSARGAYRLTKRLLVYADLADGDVDLHVFRTTESETHRTAGGDAYPEGPDHAAATFHGVTDDGFRFGIDVQNLGDDETLVTAMCHEVAHAFRETHELMVTTEAIEEQLTDLTTVYLGFGVLTTNGAYRYRTKGGLTGTYAWQSASARTLGYLSAGDMVFLLAVQIVTRGAGAALVRRIAKHLEANQAELFREAVAALLPERAALLAALGVPPEETWPAPAELAPFLRPFEHSTEDRFDDAPPCPVKLEASGPAAPTGEVVFRVRRQRTKTWAATGGGVGFLAGMMAVSSSPGFFWALTVGGVVAGYLVGRSLKYHECSECDRRLTLSQTLCEHCGGSVKGTIAAHGEREAALAAFRKGTFVSR